MSQEVAYMLNISLPVLQLFSCWLHMQISDVDAVLVNTVFGKEEKILQNKLYYLNGFHWAFQALLCNQLASSLPPN